MTGIMAISITTAVLAVGHYRRNQMSYEVRRALTALFNPNTTQLEAERCITQVRALLKTKRDREIFSKVEMVMQLGEPVNSSADCFSDFNRHADGIESRIRNHEKVSKQELDQQVDRIHQASICSADKIAEERRKLVNEILANTYTSEIKRDLGIE